MPRESLVGAEISQPVRDATGKAFSRAPKLQQLQRKAAENPADTDVRAEYVKVQRGSGPSATGLANLDVEKESAAPVGIKKAAPASSSVVKLPEGSAVLTKGAVTAYRPKGDPYRYTYNADIKAFSVYNLDGTPVRENVTQGMSGYEDFLKHAGGGRTKYFRGATAPKTPSSSLEKKEAAASEETAPAPVAEEAAPAQDEPAPLLDFDQDSPEPVLTSTEGRERRASGAALASLLYEGNQPILSKDGVLNNNAVLTALAEGSLDKDSWPRIESLLREKGLIRTQVGAPALDVLAARGEAFENRLRASLAAKAASDARAREERARRKRAAGLLGDPAALAEVLGTVAPT